MDERSTMEAEPKIALEVAEEGASVAIAFNARSLANEVRSEDEKVVVYVSKLVWYEQTPVGVAMGLAMTSIGGLAWYLKTTLIEEGKGIGCLHVMGEVDVDTYRSAVTAHKLAKKILLRKQSNNKFFANSKIYVEFPTANGQSAGCTITTSLLSLAMNKPVRKNLAMTGVITLTGSILPIGDVKEKTRGAKRSQVKTIIFPEANRREFDELAENVKEGLDVHFVDEYEQIFELAFNYDH